MQQSCLKDSILFSSWNRQKSTNEIFTKKQTYIWILSCLPKYAAQCLRTQLLSPWSGKYFLNVDGKYFSNVDGKYFPILWLSECSAPTPCSIIVTVTGKRQKQKNIALFRSVSRFSDVSVCAVGNWYLVEAPEMSLTAFYSLLLLLRYKIIYIDYWWILTTPHHKASA